MTRVKICGITSEVDAGVCVETGADALGFIFVERTPRYVPPDRAAAIIRTLPPFVTPVGVFSDHPAGHVKMIAEACGLRALQLHGDETPEEAAGYTLPVIKTIKLGGRDDLRAFADYRVAAFLLDSHARWSEGEARAPIAWDVAREAAERACVVLAAGLTADNVARAIEVVRPYAVDVSSGVEARPGRKDPALVRRFLAEVRRVG